MSYPKRNLKGGFWPIQSYAQGLLTPGGALAPLMIPDIISLFMSVCTYGFGPHPGIFRGHF